MKNIFFTFLIAFSSFHVIANDLWAMDEADFNEVIDKIERIYPKNGSGEKIEVRRYWNSEGHKDSAVRRPAPQDPDASIDTTSYLDLDKPVVILTGTVPKAGITKDAFAILACHEFGHHVSPGPRIGLRKLVSWSAAEGQSDYWATSECLKKYMDGDDHKALLGDQQIPLEIKGKCDRNFFTPNGIYTCYRSGLAVLSLNDYFSSQGSLIDLNRKAPAATSLVRRYRLDEHCNQCRSETWLAGVFCNAPLSKQDKCSRGDGIRPSCWYQDEESK
jgi:hypothetical protein